MGLWGWAELTIGIIVGCLPVMPKLFQHIGAKISSSFSFKYGISAAHGLIKTNEPPNADAFTKVQRPFANHVGSSVSESSTDMYIAFARLHGEYPTADEYDLQSLSAIAKDEPIRPPRVVIATRRDDLEYGEKMV